MFVGAGVLVAGSVVGLGGGVVGEAAMAGVTVGSDCTGAGAAAG